MFYGYYSSETLPGDQYRMPAAYFFTIGFTLFIICIILVYRLNSNSITYALILFLLCLFFNTVFFGVFLTGCPNPSEKTFKSSNLTRIWLWKFFLAGTLKWARRYLSDSSLRKSALSSKYDFIWILTEAWNVSFGSCFVEIIFKIDQTNQVI